jgi:hypothetical protein
MPLLIYSFPGHLWPLIQPIKKSGKNMPGSWKIEKEELGPACNSSPAQSPNRSTGLML